MTTVPRAILKRQRLSLFYLLYLSLLAWVIVWKLEVPWIGDDSLRKFNLAPFAYVLESGLKAPLELIFNVLVFVPLGAYFSLLAPGWAVWKIAGSTAAFSFAFEMVQYLFAVGTADITDILTNTLGGLIGGVIASVVRRRFGPLGSEYVRRACKTVTVVGLLAAVVFFASPLHYVQKEGDPKLVSYAVDAG